MRGRGNDGVTEYHDGTYGNVQVVRRAGGRPLTSSLQRLHPEIREPKDRLPTEVGCEALVAQGSAPQLLVTNVAVASAMLSAVLGLLRGTAVYEEVYLDVARNRVAPVTRAVMEAPPRTA